MALGRVAVVGDINFDIIAFHSKFPAKGAEELAQKAFFRHGGSAANIAHAFALLGLNVVMTGCVGRDLIGKTLVTDLAKTGIDISCIQSTSQDITGVVYIFVTADGERTMLAYRGANKHLQYNELIRKAIKNIDAIFFSAYSFLENSQKETAFKILDDVVGSGCLLSMDLCVPLATRTRILKRTASVMDYVFMNVQEFEILSTQMDVKSVPELSSLWNCVVVLKRGKDGCMISTETGEVVKIPAKRVRPVDTTGAGDAFTAGFIYELLKGSTFERCGRTAVELGARASQVIGGRIDKVFLPARK
ncbi:MAG: carbohydrate kinase family protein [Candidatus Caldarchaeum sp.]